MLNDNSNKWFNELKIESERNQLSKDHTSRFEARLKTKEPIKRKKILFLAYKIAAVFILGLLLTPMLSGVEDVQHPEYVKYQETKSYFTAYVEYEIGKSKEKISPENEELVLSSLHQVLKLQLAYKELEQDFINQNYDKRILKRMIDNFRQQLDILENIDQLLNDTKQITTTDENII